MMPSTPVRIPAAEQDQRERQLLVEQEVQPEREPRTGGDQRDLAERVDADPPDDQVETERDE